LSAKAIGAAGRGSILAADPRRILINDFVSLTQDVVQTLANTAILVGAAQGGAGVHNDPLSHGTGHREAAGGWVMPVGIRE